jgi:hypothetical protein
VVFGQTGSQGIELAAVAAGSGGFVIKGEKSVGLVSDAGDVNGDGLSDLLVGGSYSNLATGFAETIRSYLVFGQTGTQSIDLGAVSMGVGGFAIDYQSSWDLGGGISSAGDVNGDGLADLIVGAIGANVYAGSSYVIFGQTGGTYLHTEVDWLGTDGADTYSDGGIAKTLVAGAGNDTLTATAASVLYGGAGDDSFVIDLAMINALQNPYGLAGNDTQLARIDGGSGIDTLKLSGSGLVLDLTQVAGSAMTPESDARLEGMEVIDLMGNGNNTLKLIAKDVLDVSGFNVFATTGRVQLMVKGDAGDTLDLADATGTSGWTHGTATTLGGVSYEVWNHNTSLATVYVNQAVVVA